MQFRTSKRSAARSSRGSILAVLVCAGMLVLAIGGAAIAQQGGGGANGFAAADRDPLRLGVSNRATNETVLFSNNDGFALRESNLSANGGGAIHGCRSGIAPTDNPCLESVNLRQGQAFSFETQRGNNVGSFIVGTSLARPSAQAPFRTNATGMVENLNADQVDGREAVCPPNTTLNAGVCYDNAVRGTANLFVAADTCQNAGGRLADALELRSLRATLALSPPPAGEWSSSVFVGGNEERSFGVASNGRLNSTPIGQQRPYRCAFELVR